MLMARNTTSTALSPTRISRTIFFLLGFWALSIIIFDSGNLITRESVIQRWVAGSIILGVNTLLWYWGAQKKSSTNTKSLLVMLLTLSLIGFAGFVTYWERGMASTSTLLYALPILVAATLHNRHLLLATATLSAGTYALAAVLYFNTNFNEGFRIQLWGHIVLYVGAIFCISWLTMIVAGLRHDSR